MTFDWNTDKGFKIVPALPIPANDDFTGADGDAPNQLLWGEEYSDAQLDGAIKILSNSLAFNKSGLSVSAYCRTYLIPNFLINGDFDFSITISSPNAYQVGVSLFFGDTRDANNCLLAYYTLSSNTFNLRKYVNGVMTVIYSAVNNPTGKVLKFVRSGNTVTVYLGTTTIGSYSSFGSSDCIFDVFAAVNTGGTSIAATFDNFQVNSGTIVWPESPSVTLPIVINDGCGLTSFDASAIFDDLHISPNDDFTGADGDAPNPLLWNPAYNFFSQSALYNIYINNNRLRVSGDATAADRGIAKTMFTLSGDYDVQVTIDRSTAKATGDAISIEASIDPNNRLVLATMDNTKIRTNGVISGSWGSWTEASITNNVITFRIARVGSAYTISYDIGAGFVVLKTGTTFTGDCFIILSMVSASSNVSVGYFDDFQVNSGTVVGLPTNNKKIALYSGETECSIQIPPDGWDAVNKSALLLATIPSLTSDTELSLYYDIDHEDNPSVTDVDPMPDPPTDPYELAIYNLALADGLWSWSALGAAEYEKIRAIVAQVYSLPWPIQANIGQLYSLRFSAPLAQKWGNSTVISSSLDSWYGSMPTVRKSLWQPFGNPAALREKLIQLINDAPLLRSTLSELYDISLGLMSAMEQSSGYTKDMRIYTAQPLGDCLAVRSQLAQKYRDALKIMVKSEQLYAVSYPLMALAEQLYHISAGQVLSPLQQSFDLAEYDSVISRLQQIYMSMPGSSSSVHALTVTVGGLQLNSVYSVSIEASRSQYFLSGEIELANYGEYLQCGKLDPVTISHNGQDYVFVVESKTKSRSVGSSSYRLDLASPAIRLDEPYALPMTTEYAAGMAADIAASIVDPDVVALTWDIVNWPIPKNTLYATDETPLAVLRRIVAAVGGILQSLPDGSLVACYPYPVDIDKLSAGPVGHYFTDSDNMFSVSESADLRSGQNVFLISDGLLTEKTHELREVEVDKISKIVQGYIYPWTDAPVSLLTSGGDWVRIEPLGVVTEELEEQAEFVAGESSAGSPIYAMLARDWQERSLGSITYGEDGSLKSDIESESLATIRYTTKYHKWLVIDNNIENVQFVLQTEEE